MVMRNKRKILSQKNILNIVLYYMTLLLDKCTKVQRSGLHMPVPFNTASKQGITLDLVDLPRGISDVGAKHFLS